MTRIIVGTLLPLLLATRAQASQLHFEAWPTPSSESCSAPCYQMRMFLQVNPWDAGQSIQAIQMDIRIGDGAVAALLPVHPARNDNAGSGNVHVRSSGPRTVGVPWDLSSAVAQSPTAGFDALMVHAARAFTVEGLTALVDDPETSCTDASKCGFVEEALAQRRGYLGFINVTRGTPPGFDPTLPEASPIFGSEFRPQGVPFFNVQVGGVSGLGDAVEAVARYGGGHGFILFLPEPSATLLLAGALALLVTLRRAS